MELLEGEYFIQLALLLVKKAKLQQKLKKTFFCALRKCFSCLGMKNIELQLEAIEEALVILKSTPPSSPTISSPTHTAKRITVI